MQCREVQGSAGRCRAGHAHTETIAPPLPCFRQIARGWVALGLVTIAPPPPLPRAATLMGSSEG